MHHDLFLGFMVASESSDDFGHPGSVVGVGQNEGAVVHHLGLYAVHIDDLSGVVHFGDLVGIAARNREFYTTLFVCNEIQ